MKIIGYHLLVVVGHPTNYENKRKFMNPKLKPRHLSEHHLLEDVNEACTLKLVGGWCLH